MARLFKAHQQMSAYRDRRFRGTQEEFENALLTSTTVYVGNLSFYTTEEQIYEVFSRTGEIKKIVMGLDKSSMTPCGFCFVLYYAREDTEDAVKYISGTILDERPVRVDFDWGFEEGRQWGRGRSGGQVRDEYRTDYDPGRGGYGKLVQREIELRKYTEFGSPEIINSHSPYSLQPRKFDGHGANRSGRNDGYRKRSREMDGWQNDSAGKSNRKEKNPRFRDRGERGDDSEEEGDR